MEANLTLTLVRDHLNCLIGETVVVTHTASTVDIVESPCFRQ